jgi:hypothetical protein
MWSTGRAVSRLWHSEIRKPRQERHIVVCNAVAKSVIGRNVRRWSKWSSTGHCAQRYVHHVVKDATTIWKTSNITCQQPKPARTSGWRIATFRRNISCGRPSDKNIVKFGPVISFTGIPVAKIATRSFRGVAGTVMPNFLRVISCGFVDRVFWTERSTNSHELTRTHTKVRKGAIRARLIIFLPSANHLH